MVHRLRRIGAAAQRREYRCTHGSIGPPLMAAGGIVDVVVTDTKIQRLTGDRSFSEILLDRGEAVAAVLPC